MFEDILIVEDETVLAKNIGRYLRRHGYEVRIAADGEDGLAQFEAFKPDLVLLDFNLPGTNGLEILKRIRGLDSRIKVILVTGHGNVQVAVDAMKAGAYDYLTKPLVLSELKLVIDKAIGHERLEGTLSYYHQKEASESGLARILGQSRAIARLKQNVSQLLDAERRLADEESPAVLVTGETGTGKALVARALHFDGVRNSHPFVEVNCASIPAHLLESEMLGYERGAFTDARERKLGLVESAHGGTLFLDEISELDLALQAKLLKLIEERTVRRLGSVRDRKVNTRIITATNRALEDLIREGKFRSDLYFRLRVVGVELPPLCERGQDIVLLAEHFLELHGRRYRKTRLEFSAAAHKVLLRHSWPGNVRELRNVVEQAVLMAQGDTIGPELFPVSVADDAPAAKPNNSMVANVSTAGARLEDVEIGLIVSALGHSRGNVTSAAESLGITRDKLRYRMEKYHLR